MLTIFNFAKDFRQSTLAKGSILTCYVYSICLELKILEHNYSISLREHVM